jgi:hypothetical protein
VNRDHADVAEQSRFERDLGPPEGSSAGRSSGEYARGRQNSSALWQGTVTDQAICPLVGDGNLDPVDAGMEIGGDFESVGRRPTDASWLSVYLEFGDVANFAEVEPNMLA